MLLTDKLWIAMFLLHFLLSFSERRLWPVVALAMAVEVRSVSLSIFLKTVICDDKSFHWPC